MSKKQLFFIILQNDCLFLYYFFITFSENYRKRISNDVDRFVSKGENKNCIFALIKILS